WSFTIGNESGMFPGWSLPFATDRCATLALGPPTFSRFAHVLPLQAFSPIQARTRPAETPDEGPAFPRLERPRISLSSLEALAPEALDARLVDRIRRVAGGLARRRARMRRGDSRSRGCVRAQASGAGGEYGRARRGRFGLGLVGRLDRVGVGGVRRS